MSKLRTDIFTALCDAVDSFDEIGNAIKENEKSGAGPEFAASSFPFHNVGTIDNNCPTTANTTEISKDDFVGLTADGRRKWKKPEGKPKRPLSAYNLFFQFQRDHIVSHINGGDDKEEELPSISTIANRLHEMKKKMNSQQQQCNGGKKRRHRKGHGKIGFGDLAKKIATKWKRLDKETKSIFEEYSNEDKIRYKKEVEIWIQQQAGKKKENTNDINNAGQDKNSILVHQHSSSSQSASSTCQSIDDNIPFSFSFSFSFSQENTFKSMRNDSHIVLPPVCSSSSLDYHQYDDNEGLRRIIPLFEHCESKQQRQQNSCMSNNYNDDSLLLSAPFFDSNSVVLSSSSSSSPLQHQDEFASFMESFERE